MQAPMTEPHARQELSIALWLVWLAAGLFVLAGLGSTGILDNNEGLYAEIPREMLASQDWRYWIIPHLNGLPYMEKPPLLYWLTAIAFALLGESAWTARLVPALGSLACVALLLWFGRATGRTQAGRLAALMFVSGIGVAVMSRVLMFDMLLTALLSAALMFAYRYIASDEARFLRWAYAFLALALLAKGFVAVILFGLVIVVATILIHRSAAGFARAMAKWFEPWAIMVFLAISLPWHIAASLTEPVFAWFYFINEHVLRFLGKREPHDYYAGPWWYYLPRMAIYLFPWSFLVPALLGAARKPQPEEEAFTGAFTTSARLRSFLWAAWLVPLLFFSVSSAKANYYLVAVMPFAAFHLACALEDRMESILQSKLRRASPGLLIALLSALACVAVYVRADKLPQGLVIAGASGFDFMLMLLGGLLALSLLAAFIARRALRNWMLPYLVLPAWTGIGLWLILKAMQATVSTEQVAAYLQTQLPGHAAFLYRSFEQKSSLPFYLKTPVPVVDMHSNDLFWGNKLRKNDIALSVAQFEERLARQKAAIVVPERQLQEFKAAGLAQSLPHRRRIGDAIVFAN